MKASKLRPFQKEGVQRMDAFGGIALLADEMGLGKSIQSLWYAFKVRNLQRVLVICPAGLKLNWQREALKHVGIRGEVLASKKPPKKLPKFPPRLYIINYDVLGAWLPFLEQLKLEMVIIDECHYAKNRSAKRTKALQKLCSLQTGLQHVVALSGTPLTNRPAELWPILNILRPDKYSSFYRFAFKYCKPVRKPWGWEYRGASNLKELHKELRKTCMIRRLKKDVLRDLPSKQHTVLPLPIANSKEYQEAVRDFLAWLSKTGGLHKMQKAKKAEQVTKLGYLLRLAAKGKMKYVTAWIDDFLEESNEKLVVFAIQRSIVEALHEKYKDESVVIHGGISMKKRQIAEDEFQHDKKKRLLFGNLQAAGVGLNLTAGTVGAFIEMSFVPADHAQASDRLHRIGQSKHVQLYYLVAQNTVEESLCKINQKKWGVVADVLDDGIGRKDFDVYDQLTRIVSRKA